MKLGLALTYTISAVIILAVMIHLWPDAQPWIQNLTGGDSMSLIKGMLP